MIVDDSLDVSATELHGRWERVREAMAAEGIALLAAYNNGQHDMTRLDPLFYLTDFYCIGPSWLLVPAAGRPALYVSPGWDAPRARASVPGVDVIAGDPDATLRPIGAALAEAAGTAALCGGDGLSVRAAGFLGGVAALRDAGKLIARIAAVKSPAEIARTERAADIADIGFARLRECARVGMREYELAAEVEATMKAAGAGDNFGLIAAGGDLKAIRSATERRLEAGDSIVGEITPSFRGYHAQLCRTFVLGEPRPKVRTNFDLLIEAERRAFAQALPGHSTAQIAEAANDAISEGGYSEFCRPPYMRTRGHGLGVAGVIPDLDPDAGVALAAGMTFVIHPNQYFPDSGYLMLGDTVVIEPAGARPLTKTPVTLFWRSL